MLSVVYICICFCIKLNKVPGLGNIFVYVKRLYANNAYNMPINIAVMYPYLSI